MLIAPHVMNAKNRDRYPDDLVPVAVFGTRVSMVITTSPCSVHGFRFFKSLEKSAATRSSTSAVCSSASD
jgi:hypothetical protein